MRISGCSSRGSVSQSLVDGKGRWVFCCPSSALEGLSGNPLPPLPCVREAKFQKAVAEGTAVTVPVGHMTLSAEEWGNVEAFGNGKTKRPAALQPCPCVHGWLQMEGKEEQRLGWHLLGKNMIHKVFLGEIPGFGRKVGSHSASSWVHLFLFKNVRHLCVDYGCRAVGSEPPYQRCSLKSRGASCLSGETTHVQHRVQY